MANVNKRRIVAGKNTAANLIKNTAYAVNQGEIAISSDTERVYIGDSTYHFKHLLAWCLPDVICSGGNVVVFNNEMVWKGY